MRRKYNTATPERVRVWKARHKFIMENDVKASVFVSTHKFVDTANAIRAAAAASVAASDFAVRVSARAIRALVRLEEKDATRYWPYNRKENFESKKRGAGFDERIQKAERDRLNQFRKIYGHSEEKKYDNVIRKKRTEKKIYDAIEKRRNTWNCSTAIRRRKHSLSKSEILLDIERHEHRAKSYLASLESTEKNIATLRRTRPPTPPLSTLSQSSKSSNFEYQLSLLETQIETSSPLLLENDKDVTLISSSSSSCRNLATIIPGHLSPSCRRTHTSIVSNIADMSLSDLRSLFGSLDEDRDGVVTLPQLKRFLCLKTLAFTKFRGWLRLAPRDIRINDAFFAHMSKFCSSGSSSSSNKFMTFDMFAASIAALRDEIPSTFWTSSLFLHNRAWTRENVMRGWTERLRDENDICGVHILRRNVRYGTQIGTLVVIPSELLRICFALVSDPEHEFYDAYHGVDGNEFGYGTLIDILDYAKRQNNTRRRREGGPDGVFCFATYDDSSNDILDQDQDTLLSVGEDIKSTATRYQGVFRSVKNIKGEQWYLRVKRTERLSANRGIGAFAAMNILKVCAKSAEIDGGVVSRDMIGDGDLKSPPLLLKSNTHFKSRGTIVQKAFPGNSFVHFQDGRLEKKKEKVNVRGNSLELVDPRREFVTELTSSFHRFLPRRDGQCTAV